MDAAPPTAPRTSILALDVGDARIGVAVSESGVIPTPLEAIDRQAGRKATLDALEALVGRYGVGVVVIGLPLLEAGAEGAQAERTRQFARSLQRRMPGLDICLQDERYTTAEARDIQGRRAYEKGRLDSIAAALILREYLENRPVDTPASNPPTPTREIRE